MRWAWNSETDSIQMDFHWIHCVSLRFTICDRRNVMVCNNGQVIDLRIAYRSISSVAINFISFRFLTHLCGSFEVLHQFFNILFGYSFDFRTVSALDMLVYSIVCFGKLTVYWGFCFVVSSLDHHCIVIIYEAKRSPILHWLDGW